MSPRASPPGAVEYLARVARSDCNVLQRRVPNNKESGPFGINGPECFLFKTIIFLSSSIDFVLLSFSGTVTDACRGILLA